MRLDSRRMRNLTEAARGSLPADLCLRNCRLVNVFSGCVESVDLAVKDGLIVGWGSYEAEQTIDAGGMYVCPGFIDGHVHLESSLLSPAQFCAAVLPFGTTAVVADPHEIANVLGTEGIRYFLDATSHIPLDVYFNLPSCVPATPLETAGAKLSASDLYSLLPHERLPGLAEMMNFPGVVMASPDVLDKLILFQDFPIDGHAPGLSGKDLNAYLSCGISSDHECTRAEEAKEKLSKGMVIQVREGSQSKDLAELLPIIDDRTWPRCMFVTDDRHPDDILREGHMNAVVNKATELGMDPVRAITLATLNPARHFRLARRGAIAPGYFADFTMSPTLSPWNPHCVFKNGVEVAREDKLLLDSDAWIQPPLPSSPMRITRLEAEELKVPVGPGSMRVIGIVEGSILTRKLSLPAKEENGHAVSDTSRDILKLAVYNRYVPDSPPQVGFVHGFGLRKGAMATTVAHDSHNLIVAGTSDAAMIAVAEAVKKSGGGLAIGSEDSFVEVLPLPIAGLMSDRPIDHVVGRLEELKRRAQSWGCSLNNPFMALSFLALPVIPELKLTDKGLVDVSSFSLVSLFEG